MRVIKVVLRFRQQAARMTPTLDRVLLQRSRVVTSANCSSRFGTEEPAGVDEGAWNTKWLVVTTTAVRDRDVGFILYNVARLIYT
jgi:hypothetical protein